MSIREASLYYNIPKSTLHDKTSTLSRGQEVTLQPKIGRFSNTFSPEYEEVLVNQVKDLTNRGLPLMKKEFMKLAFDLAEALKIPYRFSKEKGTAGKHFYYDFMQRHPDITMRTPESTTRAVKFNKSQVNAFYDNLERLMKQYKFPPSNIYNCDETKLSCVQYQEKDPATKEKRQQGKLTSAESKNITVLFCMSANGHYIPPVFVFPREKMNNRLMINAPTESVGLAQSKGWMNSDLFLQWLQLFLKHSRPTKENPVLVLLNGHCSHKTLAVINFCQKNLIHLISSPTHTTHKLQPLHTTFMKPFKDGDGQRKRTNAGLRITDYDIAGLVSEAFTKVARLDIAVSGFECTGIYPFDRNVFSDKNYLSANITNNPLEVPETYSGFGGYNREVSGSHADFCVAGSSSTTCEPGMSSYLKLEPPTDIPKVYTSEPTTRPKSSISFDPADVDQIVHHLSPLLDGAKKRSISRKRKCD